MTQTFLKKKGGKNTLLLSRIVLSSFCKEKINNYSNLFKPLFNANSAGNISEIYIYIYIYIYRHRDGSLTSES